MSGNLAVGFRAIPNVIPKPLNYAALYGSMYFIQGVSYSGTFAVTGVPYTEGGFETIALYESNPYNRTFFWVYDWSPISPTNPNPKGWGYIFNIMSPEVKYVNVMKNSVIGGVTVKEVFFYAETNGSNTNRVNRLWLWNWVANSWILAYDSGFFAVQNTTNLDYWPAIIETFNPTVPAFLRAGFGNIKMVADNTTYPVTRLSGKFSWKNINYSPNVVIDYSVTDGVNGDIWLAKAF